ncbi:MBL fold metallo-hydrolase [Clostridium sp. SHJSY1]|uniref:MBL fold metallo-hydrolase n=1 Tax=Clostridium sp. SHJSY1 TaxID=2942483 RepID=UPI002876F05F|nr:MBL fold metallo-hydrolase [Clostridium sp. SHJSY1]MDS0525933.1 MBL fold metallo-hydrolase [Clostridium sp. SHJSY1]
MKVTFLGGAGEVGASCILVNINNKNILLDCGIRQGANKDPLPDLRLIQENGGVDAIILSHAHMDHSGSLPLISKEYPLARIYMNIMTKDLIKVLLYDSIKVMNNRESDIPLYAVQDVENMLNRIFAINYQREFEILEGIKIAFYSAGHIAGASCVNIISEEGSLFYSGDFSIFAQNSIEGAKIPKLRPDVAIFESTYGDKLHSNRQVEEERLIELVEKCIEDKGKMLIPAFALGRSQEIILILKKAMNKGRIKKVNVYIDGMIKDINRVYKLNPLYLKSSLGKKVLRGVEPFYDEHIKAITQNEEREEILKSKEASIIISSSGMLTGGPSQSYAEKIAMMENGYIVLSGYQDEESPGRKLLNLVEESEDKRVLEINNKIIPVKCKFDKVGLSAHADKTEIKALTSLLSPKHTILVHGEASVINSIGKEISEELFKKVYVPISGDTINLEINNPRKQSNFKFYYIMNEKESLDENNIPKLWNFININYENRFFTIEQILTIWSGTYKLDNEEIEKVQNLISKSIYFENDLRRFFMFKARSEDQVNEDLMPKELKQNEVNDLVVEYFKDYNYKKISLKIEEKKVLLNFDFPKSVPETIKSKTEKFKETSGWDIDINEQANYTAAETLIRTLLKDVDIRKISLYAVENKYIVLIDNENLSFENEKEIFKNTTGIELSVQSKNSKEKDNGNSKVFSSKKESIEQNQAFLYIDEAFKYEEFKPYKKSLKPNKLIELVFISPFLGERYEEKIREIAEHIGWNMSIASSVNQNELTNLALRYCMENNISIKKNPSYNPANFSVTIKTDFDVSENKELIDKICGEFKYNTGCDLHF